MEAIKVKYWCDYIETHPKFTGCSIDKENDKSWYQNGEIHREDGHAVEMANGTRFWYRKGEVHREDGPTVEVNNDVKYWYLNNEYYSEQDWKIAMRKIKLARVLKRLDNENNTL